MNLNQFALAAVAAVVACGSANARGIVVDGWTSQGTSGGSDTATAFPSNVEGFSLTGVTSLSFSPGNDTSSGWAAAYLPGASPTSPELEYAFGGSLTNPDEQIIIEPLNGSAGKAAEFIVSFNYLDGFGIGQTASLTLNGVKYTETNPSAQTAAVDFDIKNGAVLSTTFTKGSAPPTNAPEIDPSSAASALTLLAGGLAIVLGSKRRRLISQPA